MYYLSILLFLLGLPSLQKCICEILVRYDLEFDLKCEISDGKKLLKILGEDFSTCQESAENFRANFGANFLDGH